MTFTIFFLAVWATCLIGVGVGGYTGYPGGTRASYSVAFRCTPPRVVSNNTMTTWTVGVIIEWLGVLQPLA